MIELSTLKLGDVIRFDGVEYSQAYRIPKEWRRRLRVKVKSIQHRSEDGSTLVELEMPEFVPLTLADKSIKRIWSLGVIIRAWTADDLEYLHMDARDYVIN